MARRWVLLGIGVLALAATSCGGDDDGTDPPRDSGPPADPTFTAVYTTVIRPNCSCHTSASGAGGLVMSNQEVAFGNLVGTDAFATGMCGGSTRVVAGDAASSVLYRKVSGENLCGARMPRGGGMLPARDIDLIEAWINAGAPE